MERRVRIIFCDSNLEHVETIIITQNMTVSRVREMLQAASNSRPTDVLHLTNSRSETIDIEYLLENQDTTEPYLLRVHRNSSI